MLEAIIVGRNPVASEVAEVEDNCLLAVPVSPFEKALAEGRAWYWAATTYDPDALDTIIAIRNEDRARILRIKRLWFTSDTASQIQIWAANGNAIVMAGTAVAGVNARREVALGAAMATCFGDETGNGEQALGYPGLLQRRVVGVNGALQLDLENIVALPFRHMLGIDLTTAATAADVALLGWFE